MIDFILTFTVLSLSWTIGFGHEHGHRRPPTPRKHQATEAKPLVLIPANHALPNEPMVQFTREGNKLKVEANGIPKHRVGTFPNRHNPNRIEVQSLSLTLTLGQGPATKPIPLHNSSSFGPPNQPFGIANNGVLFDPGTAEFYLGDRRADWNYEALGGAVPLGLDENHGHVQPNGSYHYHGLPEGLLSHLGVQEGSHSPLIGWAMDGHPIFALYGYKDPKEPKSGVKKLRSSYRLISGKRDDSSGYPRGAHDGAFARDYEYVPGLGDLDACNGRYTITKDFPDGAYAYFLTENWPVIPRYFKSEPVKLRESLRR
jgi:hypothetical protein